MDKSRLVGYRPSDKERGLEQLTDRPKVTQRSAQDIHHTGEPLTAQEILEQAIPDQPLSPPTLPIGGAHVWMDSIGRFVTGVFVPSYCNSAPVDPRRLRFDRRPINGWTHSYFEEDLQGMISTLERACLTDGQVARLAIVAHSPGTPQGDHPVTGAIQLKYHGRSFTLDATSIQRYRRVLQKFEPFLDPFGRVIWTVCCAGQSGELLTALSLLWPGRTVIGFNTIGYLGSMGNQPGQVHDTNWFGGGMIPMGDRDQQRYARNPLLTEYSVHAVWAYHGRIVRGIPYQSLFQR
jgi:hypothetical protein